MRETTASRHSTSPPTRPPVARGGWNDSGSEHPSIAFLSTYPPARCGIASFTRSLADALAAGPRPGPALGVIRLEDAESLPDGDASRVVARVVPGAPGWAETVALAAGAFDLLSIQHEYGIYGPDDGISLLEVLELAPNPVFTTLHTIPASPSPRQRLIIDELAARSARLMVMTNVARERLLALYRAAPEQVVVIPHGAHQGPLQQPAPSGEGRPIVLTWGLIGPGKGIETAIRALQGLRDWDPAPLYLVCGQTHPNVRRRDGEAYRQSLEELAAQTGVADLVRLVDGYMDRRTLSRYLARARVVLLPYDSVDQVTSGVLVEALAAGRPVVATAFPHAVEALSGGAGRVVRQRDPEAMALALSDLLREPAHREAEAAARAAGARLLWPAVASRFEAEARRLVAKTPAGGI